jgi:hypothetical protein
VATRHKGSGRSLLSERALFAEAGELSFARGQRYVDRVRGLKVTGSRASASVTGTDDYAVKLRWTTGDLDGSCTCPHWESGFFCKHLVAVGLAALAGGVASGADDESTGSAGDQVDALIERMDPDELRDLVRDLAERDGGVRRLLEVRASTASGDAGQVSRELVAAVNAALSGHGFVDYHRSFDVASHASELLDELEEHLEGGAADVVRPALLRAVTRLRKVTENADDSSGSIGAECQRAADLYARSCREGNPDGLKLAHWLVKFRDSSPGWPEVTLADFVEAFDDKALAAYRKDVAVLDAKYVDLEAWKRYENNRMQLELADHDEDVDRAIEILSSGEHPAYGEIITRLGEAGRDQEVVAWIDRAVSEKRVAGHSNEYWLSDDFVAETYRRLGRVDDALSVLRAEFTRQPGADTLHQLVEFANREGRGDSERTWAMLDAHGAAARQGSGRALVEIALSESDLDAAWAAADAFGAGGLWEKLAKLSADSRPIHAGDLYRPHIEKALTYPNAPAYPGIADQLARMRELYVRGGAEHEFAAYIAQIRDTYARRPALMKALDRKRL